MNLEEDIVLEGYGVRLKRLTHDKIEVLRNWRNDPKIQQYMFYRAYITPEMQERWFAKLDKKCNFYFIIEYGGKEVGCVNIKDIDWKTKTGEPGSFIYEDEYLNSDVAQRANFLLGDFIWKDLQLETLIIEVVRSNKRAMEMNKAVGYKEVASRHGDPEDMVRLIMTREDALKPNKLFDRLRMIFNKTK